MTSPLSQDEKVALNNAVELAEETSGLEISVMLVEKPGVDPRKEAEIAFAQLGLPARPAVLIVVNTADRSIEVLTSSEVEERLSDVDCEEAITLMTGLFAFGDLAGGLTRGVEYLGERAGVGEKSGPELPNLIDGEDL